MLISIPDDGKSNIYPARAGYGECQACFFCLPRIELGKYAKYSEDFFCSLARDVFPDGGCEDYRDKTEQA
jgi:hypothetical protein